MNTIVDICTRLSLGVVLSCGPCLGLNAILEIFAPYDDYRKLISQILAETATQDYFTNQHTYPALSVVLTLDTAEDPRKEDPAVGIRDRSLTSCRLSQQRFRALPVQEAEVPINGAPIVAVCRRWTLHVSGEQRWATASFPSADECKIEDMLS